MAYYYLTVEYPAALYFSEDLDSDITAAVGVESDGSGCGFGLRDLGFSFDSEADAHAAAERARQVHHQITASYYAMDLA